MARPGLKVDPKFRRLVFLLKEAVPHVLGYLECLWSVAYESGDPLIGDKIDIELAAEWPGEAGKLCQALLDCRFIDESEPGRFSIHDLFDHAPDYVRRRMERETERQAKGKTLRGIRSEAGRKGGKQTKANDGHLLSGEKQTAQLPLPLPAPILGDESPKPLLLGAAEASGIRANRD